MFCHLFSMRFINFWSKGSKGLPNLELLPIYFIPLHNWTIF